MKAIRIAAAVMPARVGRIGENLDRMAHWIDVAAGKEAGLICFPELTITGYTHKEDIRTAVQAVPGSVIQTLEEWAEAYNMVILAGLAEQDTPANLFLTHLVVTPSGLAGHYRKTHLAPPEQAIFDAGQSVPVFTALGMTFGVQLCYDAHFPELSTRMAQKGVDVIFMPHASPRGTATQKHESWMRHLRARAFDNSVFVVACNQCGKNGKGLSFPGNAVVIGPSGEILETRLSGDEGLLVADLDPKLLTAVRGHKMRYFFPNRRPDVYSGDDPAALPGK
ncbi:MAG: nitrilase [Desulfobacteraceae bacterium]|nr:nitrilase [Desulfobacteraceae bacterium]